MSEPRRRPTSPPPDALTDEHEPDAGSDEVDLGGLVSQALDIVKYAPIAIVLDGPAMLPKLAEQGKVHVKNAQWLGRMFLDRSLGDLKRRAEEVGTQAVDLLRLFAGEMPDDDAGETDRSSHRAPVTRLHPREAVTADRPATGPSSEELAIPDYDSLSASQVVNRLPSLSADELQAVYAYESAQRGRKTILNKVAQLQVQ